MAPPKMNYRRLLSRFFYSLSFLMFTLVFLRYLYSDNQPDRPFPKTFRPERCDGCFPYVYKRIVTPRIVCRQDDVIDLVVLITTVPSQTLTRDAIRATWTNVNDKEHTNVRFLFLFGWKQNENDQAILRTESDKYGDILQDDFEDNYYNLSIKVLMGYKWVRESCKQAAYVMRTADDNFVNIPQVLSLLRSRGEELKDYMVGMCYKGSMPFRWPFHKWMVSLKEYPRVLFPSYCLGTTFITSFSLMDRLYDISKDVPFFPIEDVYFGMCMKQLRDKSIKFASIKGFNLLPNAQRSNDKCIFPRPLYSVHPVNIQDLVDIWKQCGHPTLNVLPTDAHSTLPMRLINSF